MTDGNYINALQELIQKNKNVGWHMPTYDFKNVGTTFECECVISDPTGREFKYNGNGPTKKDAKAIAAESAFRGVSTLYQKF